MNYNNRKKSSINSLPKFPWIYVPLLSFLHFYKIFFARWKNKSSKQFIQFLSKVKVLLFFTFCIFSNYYNHINAPKTFLISLPGILKAPLKQTTVYGSMLKKIRHKYSTKWNKQILWTINFTTKGGWFTHWNSNN